MNSYMDYDFSALRRAIRIKLAIIILIVAVIAYFFFFYKDKSKIGYKIFRKLTICAFIVIVVIPLVYEYPVKNYLTVKNCYSYIEDSGVDRDKIKRVVAYKNHIFYGWRVYVTFKDDPDFEYTYEYNPKISFKSQDSNAEKEWWSADSIDYTKSLEERDKMKGKYQYIRRKSKKWYINHCYI